MAHPAGPLTPAWYVATPPGASAISSRSVRFTPPVAASSASSAFAATRTSTVRGTGGAIVVEVTVVLVLLLVGDVVVLLVDLVVSVVVVIVPSAYWTCSSGAALGTPSRASATRLPVPVTMRARALPLVQPGRATIVEGSGDELLAGPRLAGDQHRRVRIRDAVEELVHPPHGRTRPPARPAEAVRRTAAG